MTLYSYQEKLISDLSDALTRYRKVVAQMPTGSGKTYTFAGICERYLQSNDKSILILVDRKELLTQARNSLYKAYKISCQPIRAGMKYIPPAKVYVGMIESVNRRIPLIKDIGLVIIDECHDGIFNKIHQHFSEQLIIGFTATPLASSRKHPLNKYYEAIVCGPKVKELINLGIIAQNITFSPKEVVDRKTLTVRGYDFDEKIMGEKYSKQRYINSTVSAYKKHADGLKTIVFNVNVAHSILVRDAFIAAGYQCKHIDGNTPDKEREAAFVWLSETEGAILCNVGITKKGFDEPTLQCSIMNKATTSITTWIQNVARACRATKHKKHFVNIDMGGNAITHGDWGVDIDWKDIFDNPPTPSKKPGVAPIKICPECDAVIQAQLRECPFCGELFVNKIPVEIELSEFIVVTAGIDVEAVMNGIRSEKKYAAFFAIGKELLRGVKKTVTEMTDEKAIFISEEMKRLGREWVAQMNKGSKERQTFSVHKQEIAERFVFDELALMFPAWQSQLFTPPVVKLPEAIGSAFKMQGIKNVEAIKNRHYQ